MTVVNYIIVEPSERVEHRIGVLTRGKTRLIKVLYHRN
jgi:hypothetical protein